MSLDVDEIVLDSCDDLLELLEEIEIKGADGRNSAHVDAPPEAA